MSAPGHVDDTGARSLTDLPIDRPVTTLMALLAMMVLGVVAIYRLPLDFLPMMDPPSVQVVVPFPGSHPLETLRQIAEPIEGEVATIPDIKELSSESSSGEAIITAVFDNDVNMDLKKLEVREAVERAVPLLPEGVGQIVYRTWDHGNNDGTILGGRISAQRNLSESWELLDQRVRRPLERISGVARVELGGVEAPQLFIELDLDACRRHGIVPQQVLQAVQGANLDLDLGGVTGDSLRYSVRTEARFKSVEEVAALPVAAGVGDDGEAKAIRLSDVADVRIKEAEIDYGRHLDREFAISIDVFKEPTANTVATVDRLMARIAEIEKDPQLKGIKLLVWNDAGKEIRNSINNLRDAGIFGGLLAMAVLMLFLRRVQTTLIVAVAIPFSLIATCGGMYLLGSQFNVLTMLGLMLGVGMLVDNAVVVIENIYRNQNLGMSPERAARLGVRQVAMAVVASTATSIIVWAWLFVAERSEMTTYLGAVALTICLAVSCSLLVSLTFIPLAASRLSPPTGGERSWLIIQAVPAYRRVLAFTLRHRLGTLLVLLGLAGSAYFPFSHVEIEGQPTQREEFITLRYEVHDEANLATKEGYVDQVEAVLEANQQALGYTSMYSWYSERQGAITRLYVPTAMANQKGLAELKDKVRPLVPTIPGVKISLSDRRWWRRGGESRWVRVDLHGEDPEFLQELALDLERRVRGMDDVREVYGPSLSGLKEARILVDPERARALGVSPQSVAQAVAFTYRGRNLRRFQGESGELEMRIGLSEEAMPGLASLRDLSITSATGALVPLGSVAEIVISRIDKEIEREERQTTSRVAVEWADNVTREEGTERMKAVMAGFSMPEGYGWDFGSWGRRQEQGLDTMALGVGMSLLGVVLLMAALFESFAQPLAIVITLPLAFFGGLWGLWLGDYKLDTVAFMGVIILIGIVVNNGIVMVDHVNQLRDGGMDRVQALITGCGDRLRPVLMTAITTIFGLVPLSMSQFTIASIFIDSLAVVVIGGLATSTVFTLLALPVWYATLEDLGDLLRRAWPRLKLGERAGKGSAVLAPPQAAPTSGG